MKKFGKYLLCAFIISFLASASAYAGEQHKPGDWKNKGWENKIYKDLKLTDGQKKMLEENKKTHREKAKTSFEKMKTSKTELDQALMQKDLDMNRINQIQSQIKAVQAEMVDNRFNSVLEIRKILTPEQFSRFLSSTEKRGKMEHKRKKQ